ncbi:hypothetical protein Trydic_g3575 [Trypoxylus dichotomus]
MEVEENGAIPFLDVLVTGKPTHTDRYLHADSNHHPEQKLGVTNSLLRRIVSISKPDNLSKELQHIKSSLQNNGYQYRNIQKIINNHLHPSHADKPQDPKTSEGTACLSFIQGATERISRILQKQKKVVFNPPSKIANILPSPEDQVQIQSSKGIY